MFIYSNSYLFRELENNFSLFRGILYSKDIINIPIGANNKTILPVLAINGMDVVSIKPTLSFEWAAFHTENGSSYILPAMDNRQGLELWKHWREHGYVSYVDRLKHKIKDGELWKVSSQPDDGFIDISIRFRTFVNGPCDSKATDVAEYEETGLIGCPEVLVMYDGKPVEAIFDLHTDEAHCRKYIITKDGSDEWISSFPWLPCNSSHYVSPSVVQGYNIAQERDFNNYCLGASTAGQVTYYEESRPGFRRIFVAEWFIPVKGKPDPERHTFKVMYKHSYKGHMKWEYVFHTWIKRCKAVREVATVDDFIVRDFEGSYVDRTLPRYYSPVLAKDIEEERIKATDELIARIKDSEANPFIYSIPATISICTQDVKRANKRNKINDVQFGTFMAQIDKMQVNLYNQFNEKEHGIKAPEQPPIQGKPWDERIKRDYTPSCLVTEGYEPYNPEDYYPKESDAVSAVCSSDDSTMTEHNENTEATMTRVVDSIQLGNADDPSITIDGKKIKSLSVPDCEHIHFAFTTEDDEVILFPFNPVPRLAPIASNGCLTAVEDEDKKVMVWSRGDGKQPDITLTMSGGDPKHMLYKWFGFLKEFIKGAKLDYYDRSYELFISKYNDSEHFDMIVSGQVAVRGRIEKNDTRPYMTYVQESDGLISEWIINYNEPIKLVIPDEADVNSDADYFVFSVTLRKKDPKPEKFESVVIFKRREVGTDKVCSIQETECSDQ